MEQSVIKFLPNIDNKFNFETLDETYRSQHRNNKNDIVRADDAIFVNVLSARYAQHTWNFKCAQPLQCYIYIYIYIYIYCIYIY
jgi:hypothetical protein